VVKAVTQMRILECCMRIVTIPNQSSVAMARKDFDDDDGRMEPSSYNDHVVNLMAELVEITPISCGASSYLTSRDSERKVTAAKLEERVNPNPIIKCRD